jgi:WhiB family transcriptional regulator, redox-sensing transcriptional regulator
MTVRLTMTRPESDVRWRAEARCAGQSSDIWFPVGETGPAVDQIQAAKAICRDCPVVAPCLEFGMTQEDGIYGGATAAERRTIVRRRRGQR